ncbi:MAG: electron transfer flavoprotein subunit alpha/FixB family protein [Candidatus Omnitrophota bacterium]
MANIGVYIELKDNQFKKSNKETLGFARTTGHDVYAVLFSNTPDAYAEELKGIHQVIVVNDDAPYDPEMVAETLAKIIPEYHLTDFLGICSVRGKDLFARVAAKIENASLINDCVSMDLDQHRFTKPVYAGKLLANLLIEDEFRLITLRPNTFTPPAETPSGSAEVVAFTAVKTESKSKIVEIIKSASKKVDLIEAEIIVSGGRGMKAKENFTVLEDLAKVLNAGLGASRAAVDAEFASQDMQVGQTGKVVNPKLYIACGISGAIQHFVGMKTSKIIVCINKDPEAPIFKKADYGIVGDLFKVVPLLTEEFKKRL